ncbi:MAG: type II secretion system F family protein [Nitriliruptoraceae bacterium]
MTAGLQAFAVALLAAYGVFLLFTALSFGWKGLGISPGLGTTRRRGRVEDLLVQAGLDRTRLAELAAVEAVLFTVAAAFGYAVYGGWPAAVAAGVAAAAIPVISARNRRRARLARAREAWPRMLEEIRLQVVTLGRSIPQALLTVGARGPEELKGAFALAQREWVLTTDLDRTLEVLKANLADPTADAVCETLLIAHEVGGTDVDRRLRALIDDRIDDLQGRKDARAKQAAVRFARWFVLIVPIGMALVGLSIGDGRAAFQTATGQVWVLLAFAMMGGCWAWAAVLLRLPEEERVFASDEVAT